MNHTSPPSPNPSIFAKERLKRMIKKQVPRLFSIIALVIILSQTYQCVNKFLMRKTGTGDKYQHTSGVPFPEITICPANPYDSEALRKNGIQGKIDIQLGAQWISNNSYVTPNDLYDYVVIPLDDIVDYVRFDLEEMIDGKTVMKPKANDMVCNQEKLFQTKPYYWNGNCFTMVLPNCLAKAGVLEMNLFLLQKSDMFIHHKGQFLSPNSRSRVGVEKGGFTKIAVSHEVVQLLKGEEYSDCVDTYHPHLTYDDCIYSNLHQLMMDKVGCTVPWLPKKDKICDTLAKSKEAFDVYQGNRRNQDYICPKSCIFTNMNFGPPVTGTNTPDHKQYAWATFYFRRDVKNTSEYVVYTTLTMIAEIEASVGLLLGANALLRFFIGKIQLDEDDKLKTVTKRVNKVIKVSPVNDIEG